MQTTPTNMWKLVANHQIKFVHGRSHAELEVDVNKRLTANLGKYEIKEVKLDFSQSGAWLAMIHYYEHVRLEQVTDKIAERKNNPQQVSGGTRHIAPSENTPMSHNAKQKIQIQPDLNSINNELDKMRPGIPAAKHDVNEQLVEPATQDIPSEDKPKKTKLPEGYEVATPNTPILNPEIPVDERPSIADLITPPSRGDLSQDDIDAE